MAFEATARDWTDIVASGNRTCVHCGLPVGNRSSAFCCVGCEAVHGILASEHLEQYYALRGRRGIPMATFDPSRRDIKWLEPIAERLQASEGHACVTLDIQGLHCVGCVWLIEQLFARAQGEHIVVNSTIGRLDMLVQPTFDLRQFVTKVERFGYLLGPPLKRDESRAHDLTWRLGFCAAIAMNSMIFAIAIYAGLKTGPLYELFTTLNFVLGLSAVAVGGTVFFRSAWRAVEQRVLHLDLPIAVGIALAFGGSAWLFFAHQAQGAYFDTLDVFITLMLLGRWLQERALEKNRAWVLASEGFEGLLARRLRHGWVEPVRCSALEPGDRLMVTPGDLLPIEGVLESGGSTFSLDWIVGESQPRRYEQGDHVPAGAWAAGTCASIVRLVSDFASSPLRSLLAAPASHRSDTARATPWFQRLSETYVCAVLTLAAAGLTGWWLHSHDLARAVAVTTSVLVVTCPCAFGIAAPLAYDMVQAGLRRRGLFVRKASFLDRARRVRRVVFDKTGTLSTGNLEVTNPEALNGLPQAVRNVLYDLAARSAHPKSAAIRVALGHQAVLEESAEVTDCPGLGVEMRKDGKVWRLGEPSWAAPERPRLGCDVALGADGKLFAAIATRECLRPDAANELAALGRDGYDVWLLSGDESSRALAVAQAVGLPSEHAIAEQSPQSKAAFLELHGGDETLFVGDGINDALAFDCALASGTPAVDRPYLPARADFFFVTPGLGPIRTALRSARVLAQVVRADLGIALVYNAVAVTLALAGRMSPLLCAVLMPVSSLSTIAVTFAALSPRSRIWKS